MEPFDQITVNSSSREPLAEQLQRQLTWLIASGNIKPGDPFPSIRQMAMQLSINMHTVRSAYMRMEELGLVSTRHGARTYVLDLDPILLSQLTVLSRSYTVGVILPRMSNPFYYDFLQGIQEGLQKEKLLLFVCDAHEHPEEYFRYYAQLSAKNVDGLLIVAFDILDYLGLKKKPSLPIVTVDCPSCKGAVVNFDLEQASFLAVRHLLEHHYERIGLITYTEDNANVLKINSGYYKALREAGIKLDEGLIARVPGFEMESGELGAHQLMALASPPRAIFTIADMLALGALKHLKETGRSVPEDVAIASINNIPIAGLVDPGLTTVMMPSKKLGQEAIRMLQVLIEKGKLERQELILSTELVVRQSCGCK